jgi:hypothetical protein
MINNNFSNFNRPIQLEFDSKGRMFVLENSSKHILTCFYNGDKIIIDLRKYGILSVFSFQVLSSDDIIIFDEYSAELLWIDFDFIFKNKIKIKKSSYSYIKFDKNRRKSFLVDNLNSQILVIESDYSISRIPLNIENVNFFINKICFLNSDILLLDTKNYCLYKYDLESCHCKDCYILKYGRGGEGYFREPSDIEVFNNKILIVDTKNYLVQFFDENLRFLSQLGSKGYLNNAFDLPVEATIYRNRVYICDFNNDRIVKFNKSLSHVSIVLKRAFIKGDLNRPSGITYLNDVKKIIVADRGNALIQIFDHNLKYINCLKTYKFIHPASVATSKIGDIIYLAVIDRVDYKNSKFEVFKLNLNNFSIIKFSQYNLKLKLNDPQDLCTTPSGTFIVADTLNRRIIELDHNSNLIRDIDLIEITNNKNVLVKSVFVDFEGNIYTLDFDMCKVYIFKENGSFLKMIDFSNLKKDIEVIRNIFIFRKYILLCVRGKDQVLIADFSGKIIGKIEKSVSWNHPVKIISGENNDVIYILDKENDRIVKHKLEFK